MTDCSNAEIRELLPEHVHGLLSEADLCAVEQHLASCTTCTEELALLQVVNSVRPRAMSINVANIVAQLPLPGRANTVKSRLLSIERTVENKPELALAAAPARSRKARSTFGIWRIAAAVTLMAGSGVSIVVARHGLTSVSASAPLGDTAAVLGNSVGGGRAAVADSSVSGEGKSTALSVGELSDYSDAELESVIKKLEKWDGAAAADPLPGVPLLPSSGASQ